MTDQKKGLLVLIFVRLAGSLELGE